MTSADYVCAYDCWVFEAGCFLERSMHPGKKYDMNSVKRALCRELHVRWQTATNVLEELTQQGVLTAEYGSYTLVGITSEYLGR